MQTSPTARRAFFVTGTDTDAGKTLASRLLLLAAAEAGYSTLGMKPVAAGAEQTPAGLRNDDALHLQAASTVALSYEALNPVCLAEPVAPHLAARHAGRQLSANRLAGFCKGVLMQRAGLTLIEGAGGWRVPLNDREYLSDLVRELQLPVILVVGMQLGCLNHAMLTAEAIYRDKLPLAGWVANTRQPDMPYREENLAFLQENLGAPLIADIPRLEDPANLAAAVPLVSLPALGL